MSTSPYLILLSSLFLCPPHLILRRLHRGWHFDVDVGFTRDERIVGLLYGWREQVNVDVIAQ